MQNEVVDKTLLHYEDHCCISRKEGGPVHAHGTPYSRFCISELNCLLIIIKFYCLKLFFLREIERKPAIS